MALDFFGEGVLGCTHSDLNDFPVLLISRVGGTMFSPPGGPRNLVNG